MARKLTAAKCRNSGCVHLSARVVKKGAKNVVQAYCKHTGAAPGKMHACPLKQVTR